MISLVIYMQSVGIICEYNPFHNGHLYHIQKTKKLFPEATLILIVSGNVTQRGEISILTKWEKTEIALHYGVDLVVELPYLFASQSADIFCYGAMKILNSLKINAIVFGSELGEIGPFIKAAKVQLYSQSYQEKLTTYLTKGLNYPTSLAKALQEESSIDISKPNDLLGLGFVKEIIKNQYPIEAFTITRTNNYHDLEFSGRISSASSIREHLKKKKDLENTVPRQVLPYLDKPIFLSDFFPYIQYKILSEDDLEKYVTVDEKIKNRMKEKIVSALSLEEFLQSIKTRYYTYNRLMRMCSHILFSFKKEENDLGQIYIRVLGFSQKGKYHLNIFKKEIDIPIITNYSNDKTGLLTLDDRVCTILSLIKGKKFLEEERSKKPIQS